MLKIGLTGGIGSGKTIIARVLSEMGYPVYIADKQASQLMNCDPVVRRELIRHFGDEIYIDEITLNKPRLAEIIFSDSSALATVNRIVHPRVIEDFRQWSSQQAGCIIFFESAILIEANLQGYFDYIVCISVSPETQMIRVQARDHITIEKVQERMKNQMDNDEKCRQSDFIIYNNNEMVLPQLLRLLQFLKTKIS